MKKIISQLQSLSFVTRIEDVGYNLLVVECKPEAKEPILITEDGVPLFDMYDECWYVRLENLKRGIQPFVHADMANHTDFKYFSTKQAAKEFIKIHKTVSEWQELIRKEEVKPMSVDWGFFDPIDAISFHVMMNTKPIKTKEDRLAEEKKQSQLLKADQLKDGEIYIFEFETPHIVRFHKDNGEKVVCLYSQLRQNGDFYLDANCFQLEKCKSIRLPTPAEAQTLIRAEVANNYFHGHMSE
jgi:hypothetical protein